MIISIIKISMKNQQIIH